MLQKKTNEEKMKKRKRKKRRRKKKKKKKEKKKLRNEQAMSTFLLVSKQVTPSPPPQPRNAARITNTQHSQLDLLGHVHAEERVRADRGRAEVESVALSLGNPGFLDLAELLDELDHLG